MTRSKSGLLVLSGTCVFSGVLIALIHDQQQVERDALHQGVIRDKELYRMKVEELGPRLDRTGTR
jgi:hypothetical protein